MGDSKPCCPHSGFCQKQSELISRQEARAYFLKAIRLASANREPKPGATVLLFIQTIQKHFQEQIPRTGHEQIVNIKEWELQYCNGLKVEKALAILKQNTISY